MSDIPSLTVNQDTLDPELNVLQSIHKNTDHIRQRDLARIVGLSLGMTNAIIKRLAQKGWLTIRKVNNRNIKYAVSSEGIEQITKRSYSYFKRTIRNIVYYRDAIEEFVRDAKTRGCRCLMLVGRSDLDFIIEHACSTYGIEYVHEILSAVESKSEEDTIMVLYSETQIPDVDEKSKHPAAAFLQEVVSGTYNAR